MLLTTFILLSLLAAYASAMASPRHSRRYLQDYSHEVAEDDYFETSGEDMDHYWHDGGLQDESGDYEEDMAAHLYRRSIRDYLDEEEYGDDDEDYDDDYDVDDYFVDTPFVRMPEFDDDEGGERDNDPRPEADLAPSPSSSPSSYPLSASKVTPAPTPAPSVTPTTTTFSRATVGATAGNRPATAAVAAAY